MPTAATTSPGGQIFDESYTRAAVKEIPRGSNQRVARWSGHGDFWDNDKTSAMVLKGRESQRKAGTLSSRPPVASSIRRASTTCKTVTPDQPATLGSPWLDDQSVSAVGEKVRDLRDSAEPPVPPTAVTESLSAEDIEDQAGTTPVAPPEPMHNDSGSECDDSECAAPIYPLPRTLNTAASLNAPDLEVNRASAALLDAIALAQDAADEATLPEASGAYEWTTDYATYRGGPEEFTAGTPGPTEQHDTPYGAFSAIWDGRIVRRIADTTNLYAERKAARMYEDGKLTDCARINRWQPTDVDEIYVYFAVLMYMAIDVRTTLKEYWMADSPLEMPRFRSIMSYSRFVLLNSMLHFVDDNADVPADADRRVHKLQPIVDHCNEKFQSLYVLHRDISIDHSLTLWKGHLGWVQDVASKTARFGIKTYELCETSSGYLWRFIVYAGNNRDVGDIGVSHTALVGETSAIVLTLMEKLFHKGYCLTIDDFYSSPALARHLKSLGTDCVGTLRRVRKNVPDGIRRLDREDMTPGAVVAQHCGDISLLAWNDAKLVTTISTFHNADMYHGKHAGSPRMKPAVVKHYNSAMGGLDTKDRQLSRFLMERQRGSKWYIKMFRRLLNASISNALTMHRITMTRLQRRYPSHRGFRYQLAEEILYRHSRALAVERPVVSTVPARVPDDSRYDGVGHSLYPIKTVVCARCLVKDDSNCRVCKTIRRKCVWCYKNKINKQVWYECKKCAKTLCPGHCFDDFHTPQV